MKGLVDTAARIEFVANNLAPRPMRRDQKLTLLESRQALYQRNVEDLNRRLKAGSITPDQWFESMQEEVKDLYSTAYVIGRSGRYQDMTFQDWGVIGNLLRRQYSFLRGFRDDLREQDLDEISLPQINNRARLYGEGASVPFEKGYGAEVGLPPNVLPAHPGEKSLCGNQCKCKWAITIIDKQNQDFNASWRLTPSAESCRTCVRRQRHWSDLKIRNGALVDSPRPIFDDIR